MDKKSLCLAIIFALFITIYVFPTIICSTLILASVTIFISNMVAYKTFKHYNMWDKVKLNRIHKKIDIKLRSNKPKTKNFLIDNEELCLDY